MTQRGGRIRGQGTFGCVFQPPLLCRNKDIKAQSGEIGKIAGRLDAENEIYISNHLRAVPDSIKYAVLSEAKGCIPAARSMQQEADLSTCKFLDTTPLSETEQIYMPWAGYPLSRINLSPDAFDFFRFMEELLAIGAFMVLNNTCHFDIYGQNILFDKNNKPRLIDFGFAFIPEDLNVEVLDARWRQISLDHDTETPEVTLMLGIQDKIAPNEIIAGLIKAKPAIHRLASLCDVLPSSWGDDLRQWSKLSNAFQASDWLTCWKLYWPGFDAWGYGTVLLEILELQSSLKSFAQNPRWNLRKDVVKDILKGLCHAHPAYRMDAVEALSVWTDGKHSLVAAGSSGAAWVAAKAERRLDLPPV